MTTEVEIYGMRFKIKGASDSAYVKKVAEFVNRRMAEISKMDPRLDVTRLAILTAVNLAGDLIQVEEEYKNLIQFLEQEAKEISE